MQDIHNQNIILHSESEQTQPSESKDTEKSDKKDKRRKRKYVDTTDTIIYKKHDDNDDNDNPPPHPEPSTRLGKHSLLSSSRTTRSSATQKGNSSRSHGRQRSNQLPDGLSLRYAQDLFGLISQQVRETILNRSHDAPALDEREDQPRPALG